MTTNEFTIGDSVKVKQKAWDEFITELSRFGFKEDEAYEVSGVYRDGTVISIKGGYSTYHSEYFELCSENSTKEVQEAEYTGGSSNYYKVFVNNPTTLESPYEAECNDIIEALKMTFAEGNAFKAIWRKAKARQGVQKKGYDNGLYDSEKVVFFGERMVVEAKNEAN